LNSFTSFSHILSLFTLFHNYQVVRNRQVPNILPTHHTRYVLNISSTSAPHVVNSRGLSGQPYLTPFVVSNLLSHPPSLCFLFLRVSPQSSVPVICLFLSLSPSLSLSLSLPLSLSLSLSPSPSLPCQTPP
jgi:hypothetical protein